MDVIDNGPTIVDPIGDDGEIAFAALARTRRECPVAKTRDGFWLVSRYEDVSSGVKAVDHFTSSFRSPGVVVADEEKMLFEIGEPRHGQVRKVINASIALHKVTRLEPFIRALCAERISGFLAGDHDDFLEDVIAPISTIVISHLIGVPPEDHAQFKAWSDEVVAGPYVTENRTDRGEGLAGGHPEFAAYLDARIAESHRAVDPPDCLLTKLVQAEVEGFRLSDTEIRTQAFFIVIAGNETTRHAMGNLVQALALDPELYEQICADRGLIPIAVEESLRHDSPTNLLMRDCIEALDIADTTIVAGDKVVFSVSSANRDETHYDEPDRFRLDRPDPRDHLAFGAGPHICPGAALARLEARIFLDVLCDLVATLELPAGHTVRKNPVFWSNGPAALPVRCVAR
jgi:cytochrome P450